MSKTGSTKNQILNLLLSGNKTLSDISTELHLAPSTVSQHLQELKNMGAIKEVENEHIRKWKYYELNPEFNYNESPIGEGIIQSRIPRRVAFYALGLAIIAAVAYVLLSYNNNISNLNSGGAILSPQNGTYMPIRLTDPPNVPSGTSALVISYSSVSAHVNSNSISGWIKSNDTGTIDLMSLLNVSQVIAGIKLPKNYTINQLRFNITSAHITINGTVYNVTVPSGQVTTKVAQNGGITANSSLLIDLSPTVVAIYTGNSTVFVMVPAVKAVVTNNGNANAIVGSSNHSRIGDRHGLTSNDVDDLAMVQSNITITNASISATNDIVTLKITVKNNGNQSVDLRNVLIVGNQTPEIIYNSTCGGTPSNGKPAPLWCRIADNGHTIQVHIKAEDPRVFNDNQEVGIGMGQGLSVGINTTQNASGMMGIDDNGWHAHTTMNLNSTHGNISTGAVYGFGHFGTIKETGNNNFHIDVGTESGGDFNSFMQSANSMDFNNTELVHLMAPSSENENETPMAATAASIHMRVMPFIPYTRGIDFLIEKNGTLALENQIYAMPMEERGMMIPLQNNSYMLNAGQTATFTFTGQISLPGDFRISLVPGAKYRVAVYGPLGAHAVANVTAT